MRVCLCLCLCLGDGEQVDRELDRDHRDHGVRELDALRLQDGYLLCVMDCFVVVVGLAIARWAGFLRGLFTRCCGAGELSRKDYRSPVPGAVIPRWVYGYESVCINLTSNFYHRKKT